MNARQNKPETLTKAKYINKLLKAKDSAESKTQQSLTQRSDLNEMFKAPSI